VIPQLVEQLGRQRGEIVDEIQRVLDLVRDAGGELAERRHLLGVDQARLDRLEIPQRRLGHVPGSGDSGDQPGQLVLLALQDGDVGVDRDQAAVLRASFADGNPAAIREQGVRCPGRPAPAIEASREPRFVQVLGRKGLPRHAGAHDLLERHAGLQHVRQGRVVV